MVVFEAYNQTEKHQFATEEQAQAFAQANTMQVREIAVEEVALSQKYTLKQIVAIATEFQYEDFDAMGIAYLNEVKMGYELYFISIGATEPQKMAVLPYAMILAIRKWIARIWEKYDFYKANIANGILVEEVDFSSVGAPPCTLKDVQWVVEEAYRTKHPNRQVNQDILFYQNYAT